MTLVIGLGRRAAALLVVLLAAATAAGAQELQRPKAAFQIAAVEVAGGQRLTREDVAKLSGLSPGATVEPDGLQAAAERLASTGLFQSVEYRYVTAGARLTVTFVVVDADWSVPVVFDNFVWLRDEELIAGVREGLPSFDGAVPQNENVPDLVTRSLQKLIAARGIPGTVTFMPQTNLATKSLHFLFKVVNPSPRICAVAFQGVSPGPQQELTAAAATLVGKDYSRFFVGSLVDATLIDIYRRLGHWRATFSQPSTAVDPPGCRGVAVTLAAQEGRVYAWQAAEWKGNRVVTADVLDKLLGMKAGEVADGTKMKSGLARVSTAYGKQGYVLAKSSWTPRLDDAAGRGVFEIDITEGPQFRMGTLQFVGFPADEAARLSRKWHLRQGDVYDTSYPAEFMVKEVFPLRGQGGGSPAWQFEIDADKRVVNLRIMREG